LNPAIVRISGKLPLQSVPVVSIFKFTQILSLTKPVASYCP
jgi:hypothetical protein